MAKLLIIDKNIENVKRIQWQFRIINTQFSKDSTFCFVSLGKSHDLVITPLSDLPSLSIEQPTSFYGKQDIVLKLLEEFISSYEDEDIMILINGLLISETNVMIPGIYYTYQEYSCLLYQHLIKWKNGYNASLGNNFYFLMYSPSSASVSTISQLLKDLYDESEEQYFPKECCMPSNIS